MGSAYTYGRRYALAAMVGIAQVDDDGNAAQGVTLDDVRAAAKAAIARVGRQVMMETLSSMGWERSEEIPPESRGDVIAVLNDLRSQEAA